MYRMANIHFEILCHPIIVVGTEFDRRPTCILPFNGFLILICTYSSKKFLTNNSVIMNFCYGSDGGDQSSIDCSM